MPSRTRTQHVWRVLVILFIIAAIALVAVTMVYPAIGFIEHLRNNPDRIGPPA